MVEPTSCLAVLTITRYKAQLLEIIDEAARLRESEKRKKAECVELRRQISLLKSNLNARELELATVDRPTECDNTAESAHVIARENEELKALRDNLKNLLEATQTRLKECEMENYSVKQELEARKSLTAKRDNGLDSSNKLFEKFILVHGQATKQFEELERALLEMHNERNDVLNKQIEMQNELTALKAAITDREAEERKCQERIESLKEKLVASSASAEDLREQLLVEKERRKELNDDLNRACQRIADLSASREQLAEALRAAYLKR
ncbi:hypothetical protein BESB_048740 [Besnoitia besnoiti]|uniref:Uncharacterized protein n=1 Tax=Besnoitia besnoiti TaxID=94643 RepID=A0A2A9MMD0_BESBE|nr:hypothetical protein BESB_048740 [Besnoitia besnoiti]PFH36682.1 hypothetical protein BESB_048740 [Besnoitia besnoiti]